MNTQESTTTHTLATTSTQSIEPNTLEYQLKDAPAATKHYEDEDASDDECESDDDSDDGSASMATSMIERGTDYVVKEGDRVDDKGNVVKAIKK